MNPNILRALRAVEEAQATLDKVVAAVQAECCHNYVAETPWVPHEWLPSMGPRRICTNCGYEEEGTITSGGRIWTRHDYQPAALGNAKGRTVIEVKDRDEFL